MNPSDMILGLAIFSALSLIAILIGDAIGSWRAKRKAKDNSKATK